MDKSDEILLKQIEAKYSQCMDQCIVSYTNFLDVRQETLAESVYRQTKHQLYGGYEDAERRIMVFLPDYFDEISAEYDPLQILRVSYAKGGRELTHRDYLGSLLALGIDRNVTGDILVRQTGADIIILKSMGEFLLNNYCQAGRTQLKAELIPISMLDVGEVHFSEKRDSVASLRLDNIVSSAFNLARGKAQEAISSGIVYVNNLQVLKADRQIAEGDKVVLRGCGKSVLKEIGKETRKGRISILLMIQK